MRNSNRYQVGPVSNKLPMEVILRLVLVTVLFLLPTLTILIIKNNNCLEGLSFNRIVNYLEIWQKKSTTISSPNYPMMISNRSLEEWQKFGPMAEPLPYTLALYNVLKTRKTSTASAPRSKVKSKYLIIMANDNKTKQFKELSYEELKKVTGGSLKKIMQQALCAERLCGENEQPTKDCPCQRNSDDIPSLK